MSPHQEILEEAEQFGDDIISLLNFICTAIPLVIPSADCPCRWCRGLDSNPLIIFEDLQQRAENQKNVGSLKPNQILPKLSRSKGKSSQLESGLVAQSTKTRGGNNGGMQSETMSNASGVIAELPQPSMRSSTNPWPRSGTSLAARRQKRKRKSQPIDQMAVLTEERRKRAEQRARGVTPAKNRK